MVFILVAFAGPLLTPAHSLPQSGGGKVVRTSRSHSRGHLTKMLPSGLCARERDTKMGGQHLAKAASWPRAPSAQGQRLPRLSW